MTRTVQRPSRARRLIGPAVVVVAFGALIADTTFVGGDDATAFTVGTFSAEEFVEESFDDLAAVMETNAVDIEELAVAIEDDPDAAGGEFGQDLGAGRFTYQVSATGPVVEVDDDFITMGVPDEGGLDVRIPLTTALSGTPIRDATGEIGFGDFGDQTEYQSVANQLKLRVERDVLGPLDLTSLEGETLTVVGAYVSGGPPDTFIVQPVSIEAGS